MSPSIVLTAALVLTLSAGWCVSQRLPQQPAPSSPPPVIAVPELDELPPSARLGLV